jgi:hypothetical protein
MLPQDMVKRLSTKVQKTHWILLLLVSGILLFHWRGLRPGHTFLPVDLANNNLPWRGDNPPPLQNWLISDPLYQFYPFVHTAIESLATRREWLLWNPNILLGHAAGADPLFQTYYPLNVVLGLLFGAARGLTLGLWLQVVLAGILTYGWLRARAVNRPGALAGAFTYALSGYLVTWFETTFWVSTLTWLPGVMWAFERAVQEYRLRYVGLTAAALTLVILGGQLQFVIVILLFWSLYAAGRVCELWRYEHREIRCPLIVLLIVLPVTALATAVFWIPISEFLPISRRALNVGLTDPLPVQQLITLLVPNFFGNPAIPGPYWGAGNFSEAVIYVGLVGLLLACLAPVSDRRFFPRYVVALTMMAIYFTVGGPGVSWLGSAPILKYASLHRSGFILPLLVAFLAAHTLSAPSVPRRKALPVALGLVGLIGVALIAHWENVHVYWQILQGELLRAVAFILLALACIGLITDGNRQQVRQIGRWLLVLLVYADLFLFGSRFNPAGPVEQLMPPTPAITFLQAEVDIGRVIAYQRNDQVLFGPNVLSIFDLADAGGYSSLILARYHELVTAGDPEVDVWWMQRDANLVTFSYPTRPLLDLFQVSHVVSPIPLTDPGLRVEFFHDGCVQTTKVIRADESVRGRFEVRDTAINRLDLLFSLADSKEGRDELSVRLWPIADPEAPVLFERLSANDLREHATATLFFAPQTDAPGQIYEWEISTESNDTGITLCQDGDGRPALGLYGREWEEVFAGEVFIYRRLAPMPRAYVVYATQNVADDEDAVRLLLDENFERRHVALTVQPTGLPSQPDLLATPAQVIQYEPRRVVIEATTTQPGLLVLGDQYYPGWGVTVNGLREPILRTNHVMRGVLLPPGEHRLIFSFEPFTWRLGRLLSGVGLLLILVMVFAKNEWIHSIRPVAKVRD